MESVFVNMDLNKKNIINKYVKNVIIIKENAIPNALKI